MKIKRKFSIGFFTKKEVVLSEAEAGWLFTMIGNTSHADRLDFGLTDLQSREIEKWYDKLEKWLANDG